MLHRRFERCSLAGRRGLAALATITLLVFGLTATQARAEDRYVAPSSFSIECTQVNPCSIDYGVNEAGPGDTVRVAGDLGPYAPSETLFVDAGVAVVGEGTQAPLIVFGDKRSITVHAGASATRLAIVRAAGDGLLLALYGVGTALRVEAPAGLPISLRGLLRDSFVRSSAAGSGSAIQSSGTEAKLRNVTALADGAGAVAVRTAATQGLEPGECHEEATLEARNIIARGGGSDLNASAPNFNGCASVIDVAHSNFRAAGASVTGNEAAIVDQGGNQTGVEPLLAADGFHQLAGSPTIDAGIATPENGTTDIDGEPRTQDTAPDIGADELLRPPPPPTPPDTTNPVGSRLRFKPRRFRVGRTRPASIAGTSARKRRKRSPRTSRVSYRLTEDARVRFSVRRRVIGRKKGRRCLIGKRARRLRKARKCRRFVRVRGAFSHAGRRGANRFRFSGYVGGRRLPPGVYRMVAVPTDAAGNRGKRFGASFVIARR